MRACGRGAPRPFRSPRPQLSPAPPRSPPQGHRRLPRQRRPQPHGCHDHHHHHHHRPGHPPVRDDPREDGARPRGPWPPLPRPRSRPSRRSRRPPRPALPRGKAPHPSPLNPTPLNLNPKPPKPLHPKPPRARGSPSTSPSTLPATGSSSPQWRAASEPGPRPAVPRKRACCVLRRPRLRGAGASRRARAGLARARSPGAAPIRPAARPPRTPPSPGSCLKSSFKAAVLTGPRSGPPAPGGDEDALYRPQFRGVADTQEWTTFGCAPGAGQGRRAAPDRRRDGRLRARAWTVSGLPPLPAHP
jgi:hypothetical protein